MPIRGWISDTANRKSSYWYSSQLYLTTNCAFTPDAARASKWPEVIHFQCEPAASSGESGAARFGRWERRGELKSGQLYGNELWHGWATSTWQAFDLRQSGASTNLSTGRPGPILTLSLNELMLAPPLTGAGAHRLKTPALVWPPLCIRLFTAPEEA